VIRYRTATSQGVKEQEDMDMEEDEIVVEVVVDLERNIMKEVDMEDWDEIRKLVKRKRQESNVDGESKGIQVRRKNMPASRKKTIVNNCYTGSTSGYLPKDQIS
jgi:hypothetical protein